MENNMIIKMVYELDGLLGYDSSNFEGMDIQASQEKYENLLFAALKKRYPDAEIEISEGDYAKTTIIDPENEIAEDIISEIDSSVYQDFEWVVMLENNTDR